MMLEFISHLVQGDLVWILGLIFSNLHWLFAFAAAVYFFYDRKKLVAPFLLTVALTWVISDFSAVTGWIWAVPAFLSIFYISRMALIVFCSDMDRLRNILPVVFVVHFLVIFAIFNLFLR